MPALFFTAISSILSNGRIIFKFALVASFIATVVSFSVWFLSFWNDIYGIIVSFSSRLSTNYSGLLGCVLGKLGVSEWLNSVFAIAYSAVSFWGLAVGYIITYKLGAKVYDGMFKALT